MGRAEVFDDAVVHDGHQAVAADVRVGVVVGGGSVSGPAGVADAGGSRYGRLAEASDELIDAAGRLDDREGPLGPDRNDSRTVVATVLEATQT